jgi:aminopeptidase N
MSDFYQRYFGQTATTRQFKQVVEEHIGASMDWFFDQWVYGSAIPTYHFSYNLYELDNGEYEATVRVRQENVPDDFQMIVPIHLDFGEAGSALVPIAVIGPFTQQVLPRLPMKPDAITFNPFESVLAETKTEGWR